MIRENPRVYQVFPIGNWQVTPTKLRKLVKKRPKVFPMSYVSDISRRGPYSKWIGIRRFRFTNSWLGNVIRLHSITLAGFTYRITRLRQFRIFEREQVSEIRIQW